MARRRLTPAQSASGLRSVSPAPAGAPQHASIVPPIAQVSGQSAEAAALREITQGIETAKAEGRMVIDVPLSEVAPAHLVRDRVQLDRGELEALKASIAAHGQRVPAELTLLTAEGDHRYGLIAGWRRLQALSELYEETGEDKFAVLRALLRSNGAAAESYIAMVEENEIRTGLSYYERARVVAKATERGVFPDRQTALRQLFATASRAKRSKIGSFIEIYDALGPALSFPTEIPERLGLMLVGRLRQGAGAEITAALAAAAPADAASEITLLTRLTKDPVPTVSRAKQDVEELRPGLTLRTKRKDNRVTLELSGPEADDALLDKVRALLRQRA